MDAPVVRPFRPLLMNALRASPFVQAARLLQSLMRGCHELIVLATGAAVPGYADACAAPAKAHAALSAGRRMEIDIVLSCPADRRTPAKAVHASGWRG